MAPVRRQRVSVHPLVPHLRTRCVYRRFRASFARHHGCGVQSRSHPCSTCKSCYHRVRGKNPCQGDRTTRYLAGIAAVGGWLTTLLACNQPEELLSVLDKVNVSGARNIRTGQGAGESRQDGSPTPSGENIRYDTRPKGQASGRVA